MLLEDGLAQKRDILQERYAEMTGAQGSSDIIDADVRRGAHTEQGQGQACSHLIGSQPDSKPGKETGQRHAGERSGQKAQRHAIAMDGDSEADDRGHQHHALRAKVDHTRLFIDKQAERGQHERCTRVDGRCKQGSQCVHHFPQRSRLLIRTSQASSENSKMPWKMPVMALGIPSRLCDSSPPIYSRAMMKLENITPMG